MIYTKEPWEIRKGSSLTFILAKDGNGNTVAIASVFPRGVAGCETKGNANLMKAAPKMYEALKELLRVFNPYEFEFRGQHGHWQDAMEAIAEVEGKGD